MKAPAGTGCRFPRWLNAQLRFGEKLEDFKIESSSDRSGGRQGDKGETKALGHASGFATAVEWRVEPCSRDTVRAAISRLILLRSSDRSVNTSACRRNSSATTGGLADIDETTVT